MKTKYFIALLLLTTLCNGLFGQTKSFSYQGYAIDGNGLPIAATPINARFTIYDKDNPAVKYEEEQSLTTDMFGIFSALVGQGSVFNNMSLASRDYWMRVEVKKAIGGTYSTVSDARFQSVPYAKSADNGVAAGFILQYAGTTAPAGWLLCDGSAVSRTTYAGLFAVIGTSYGAGNGSTTFNLPNLKSKIPAGYYASDADFNLMGKTGGAKTQTLTAAQLPAHNHGVGSLSAASGGSHSHSLSDKHAPDRTVASGFLSSLTKGYSTTSRTTGSDGSHSHTLSGNSGSTGSSSAFNIMQQYITVNFIIRAQ
jgi:microcystin-dependent protein